MKTWFICPDRKLILIPECHAECRMSQRCAPISYLRQCAGEREWSGKPSVTQLLNGTRMAYLSLTTESAVSPDDLAFQTIGSMAHLSMEAHGEEGAAEVNVEHEGITGRFDLVEHEAGGKIIMYDFKTSGSYAVAKALGVEIVKRAKVDESGKQMMYRGKPSFTSEITMNPDARDLKDWAKQLNFYRVAYETMQGLTVDEMRVFAIVRDGGTVSAKQRGLTRNTYTIPIPRIDDRAIVDYFVEKRDALLSALESGQMPKECSPEEAWDGRRCVDYCSVAQACYENGCSYLKGGG